MKRSLLLAALTATAAARRQQPAPPRNQPKDQPLPVEPGHVMSKKTYDRLFGEQQK